MQGRDRNGSISPTNHTLYLLHSFYSEFEIIIAFQKAKNLRSHWLGQEYKKFLPLCCFYGLSEHKNILTPTKSKLIIVRKERKSLWHSNCDSVMFLCDCNEINSIFEHYLVLIKFPKIRIINEAKSFICGTIYNISLSSAIRTCLFCHCLRSVVPFIKNNSYSMKMLGITS